VALKKYQSRRDFKKTPEPRGKKGGSGGRLFVVQKHASRSLHYDFRLSISGVLVSWAVPKGPSLNPRLKRLAIRTEDHPISYGRFEGVIPKGEYGAGAVMVWDKGSYRNIKEEGGKKLSMEDALKQGRVEVFLKGEKLYGGFALVRIGGSKSEKWLLIKTRDEHADARKNPVSSHKKSILTGRTMAQIKKDATSRKS